MCIRDSAKVGLLSGGQRQALTLLMATLTRPRLLLLDEHTAALDPKTASKVDVYKRQRLGSTCHSSALARTVATILARSAWGCGKLTSPVELVT